MKVASESPPGRRRPVARGQAAAAALLAGPEIADITGFRLVTKRAWQRPAPRPADLGVDARRRCASTPTAGARCSATTCPTCRVRSFCRIFCLRRVRTAARAEHGDGLDGGRAGLARPTDSPERELRLDRGRQPVGAHLGAPRAAHARRPRARSAGRPQPALAALPVRRRKRGRLSHAHRRRLAGQRGRRRLPCATRSATAGRSSRCCSISTTTTTAAKTTFFVPHGAGARSGDLRSVRVPRGGALAFWHGRAPAVAAARGLAGDARRQDHRPQRRALHGAGRDLSRLRGHSAVSRSRM